MRYTNKHLQHHPDHYQRSHSSTLLTTTTLPSTATTENQSLPAYFDKDITETSQYYSHQPANDHTSAGVSTLSGGGWQQIMDLPDTKTGPESHRKRSAASRQQQPSQQNQWQQQQQQQPLENTTAANPRRRSAQERYLAAVAATSGSGSSSYQQQRPTHQQEPQHHTNRSPISYPVTALGLTPPYNTVTNMPLASISAPPYATTAGLLDPYHHRQAAQQPIIPSSYQQGYGRPTVPPGPPLPPLQQQQQPPQYPYYAPQQPPPPQVLASQPPPPQYLGVAGVLPYHHHLHEDVNASVPLHAAAIVAPPPQQQQPPMGRPPSERPLMKLSISLIDTYKQINTIYYEERETRRKALRVSEQQFAASGTSAAGSSNRKSGANNNGWDDDNYDYIITTNEVILGRYQIKERIGKGSFGQVVRAEDLETKREVAIKIIKSKKPFLMQAKTEIELLTHLWEKDVDDQHNIVRLLTHFMYRNHQCLVFEMLSFNLYELLKNTQFGGVSLHLIRKFAKQVLKALAFLARPDVDVIHCDLKPENILLRHPKKSGVKVIDFGSSCRSNKRMYSYIQSRFYRSPEVMLGLPYSVAIDMWSLGCILVEMHTGEPLFSGSDQFDQMQKIVKILGMVPANMLDQSTDTVRGQFFERKKGVWCLRQTRVSPTEGGGGGGGKSSDKGNEKQQQPPHELIVPSSDPISSLTEVITSGSQQKRKYPSTEPHNSVRNYELFIDLVYKMLTYNPEERIKPLDALEHQFLDEPPTTTTTSATTSSRQFG